MVFKLSVLLNEETKESQPPTQCEVSLIRPRKGASISVFTDLVTNAGFRNSAGFFKLTVGCGRYCP